MADGGTIERRTAIVGDVVRIFTSVVAPVVFIVVSGRWLGIGVQGMVHALRGHKWVELALSPLTAALGVAFLLLLFAAVRSIGWGNLRGERWLLDPSRGCAVWTRRPLIGRPTTREIAGVEVAALVVQRRKWPRRRGMEEPCDTVWIRLKDGEYVGVDGGRPDQTLEMLIGELARVFGCGVERVEEGGRSSFHISE